MQCGHQRRCPGVVLQRGDDLRQGPAIARDERVDGRRRQWRQILVGACHHVVDHALQAHLLAVTDRVEMGDAVGVQFLDLVRDDDAAATAEDLDVFAAALAQQVHHVLEELDMAALVRGDGNALRIFLQGGVDDLLHRTVMAEVDDFGAGALKNPAHDVDRGIVAIEQRCCRDEAHLVLRFVGRQLRGDGQIGHATLRS